MSQQRFEELLGRLLDDNISADELAELSTLIATNSEWQLETAQQLETAELLSQATDELKVDSLFLAALHSRIDESPSADPPTVPFPKTMQPQPAGKKRRWAIIGTVLTLAAAIAIACFFYFKPENKSAQITITDVSGEITFTGDRGNINDSLQAGDRFDGGTLELLTTESWITLRFPDSSTLTLTGRSQATVSQRKQKKIIRMKHGHLLADVTEQPSDAAMLITTPTSEIEVLGTRFYVDSQPDSTKLVVNEGLVRMKRISDGQQVEVAANQQIVATTNTGDQWQAKRRQPPQQQWKANLKNDVVFGKWVSEYEILAKKLKEAVKQGKITLAQAEKKMKLLDINRGSVYALPVIKQKLQLAVFSISRNQKMPVTGSRSAVLYLRGQANLPCKIRIGISTSNDRGEFSGTYVVARALKPKAKKNGANRNGNAYEIQVPLKEFQSKLSQFGKSLDGKELIECWIEAKGSKVELNIQELKITKK